MRGGQDHHADLIGLGDSAVAVSLSDVLRSAGGRDSSRALFPHGGFRASPRAPGFSVLGGLGAGFRTQRGVRMARPAAERPPKDLSGHWLWTWRASLQTMRLQGTWAREQRPMLDEYVRALAAAEAAREAGFSGAGDRHVRRAMSLADALVLTPSSRRRNGVTREPEDKSRFGEFAAVVPLPRRRAR